MSGPHFTPGLFDFLRELKENNEKAWFDAHKPDYESSVREPAIRFILDFGPRLAEISPHFRADPRKNGGSLFRIHRNRRFQPDAPPYKTQTGIQFRHEGGRDAHAPGFYIHLEPGACFLGVGTWRPERGALKTIREAMVEDPDGWRAAAHHPPFSDHFELGGESLVRAPRGFDPEHPLIDDLKRKDFVGIRTLTDDQVTHPAFIDRVAGDFQAGAPLLAWLCSAVGAPF